MNPDTQQNPSPQVPPMNPPTNGGMQNNAPMTENHEQKKVGPIVATLIIVLVLIIAALYLFASKINQQAPISNAPHVPTTTNSVVQQYVEPITSTSTDVQSLQNDLDNSTNGLGNQNF